MSTNTAPIVTTRTEAPAARIVDRDELDKLVEQGKISPRRAAALRARKEAR